MSDLFRLDAHQGGAWPQVCEVAVVGEAAAELAVFDLPVIDPPVDEVFEELQVLDLPESPERNVRRGLGLLKGRPSLLGVEVAPVVAAAQVIGIDAEEVGDVTAVALIE